MKQIVFTQGRAELWEAEQRAPEYGEVGVRVAYTAVSAGTERDALRTGGLCKTGYSGSGVIEAVGEGVSGLSVGDRVLVHGGCHLSHATVKADHVVKLPDNVALDVAALPIIAGFSLAGVRKTRIEVGESCMIVGLGLLGLFAVQFARLSGAMPVIAVDFDAQRRNMALHMGADIALDPSAADFAEQVRAITRDGANVVIESTGQGKALNQALTVTARFGRVSLLGCLRTPVEVDFYNAVHRPGIELIGAHSGARPTLQSQPFNWTEYDDWCVILRYLSAGRLSFDGMIAEKHSPLEAPEVYRCLCEEKKFPIGVLFDWGLLGE